MIPLKNVLAMEILDSFPQGSFLLFFFFFLPLKALKYTWDKDSVTLFSCSLLYFYLH